MESTGAVAGAARKPLDPALFEGCYHDGRPVVPPVRIGDKWTAKILVCLRDGPRRFSELRVPLRGITAKVLTESLRAMERDGFVARTVHPETPPRVEYELTPLGRSLLEPLAACCAWNRAHMGELRAARASYDAGRD